MTKNRIDDRHQDQHLAPVQVGARAAFSGLVSGPWSIWRTALQQIPGGQDDAERAEDGEGADCVWNAPSRMLNSPTKPFSPGSPADDSATTTNRKPKIGICFHKPAEVGQQAGVPPVVEHADQQEQGAGAQAVVDHLQGRAGDPLRVQREDAEHHEAQVRHRRVGDQRLDILLHQRHQRAVEDADERQRRDPRHERDAWPPGRAAGRSARSRRCPSSAGPRPGSPSRRSALPRGRRAARCGTGRSAP